MPASTYVYVYIYLEFIIIIIEKALYYLLVLGVTNE